MLIVLRRVGSNSSKFRHASVALKALTRATGSSSISSNNNRSSSSNSNSSSSNNSSSRSTRSSNSSNSSINSSINKTDYNDEYKNAITVLTKYSDITPFCSLIKSINLPIPSLSPTPIPSPSSPSSLSLTLTSINNDIIDDGIDYYCNFIYRNQKYVGNYNTNDFEKLFKALTSSNDHHHHHEWKHQKVSKLYYFLIKEKVRISLESYRILIKASSTLRDIKMLTDVSHSFVNTYKLCSRKKQSDDNPNKADHCVIEILKSLSKLHPNNDHNNTTNYNDYYQSRATICDNLFLRIKERKISSLFKQELLIDLAFGDREIRVKDDVNDMNDIISYNDIKWLINNAKIQDNYSQHADEYAFKSMQWLKRKISNNIYYNLPSINNDNNDNNDDNNDDNDHDDDDHSITGNQDNQEIYELHNDNNDNNDYYYTNKKDNDHDDSGDRDKQEKYRDMSERAIYCLLNTWRENETFHNMQNISIKYSLAIHVTIGLRRSKALLKLILADEASAARGIAVPRYIYVQAMRACSVSHNWDGIVKLFTHMINQKHSPTSKALTYVTDALINTDEVIMAARILETSSFFDYEKSLNALTKVTIGLAKSGRFDHAEEMYQLAIRCHGFDRLSNDEYGGTLLLHRAIWLCHSKRFQELEDHLIFCATRIDDETRTFNLFNHIVSRLANPGNEIDLEQAFHFVHLMLKINVEPSKSVLDTLLDNAIDSGRSMRAASLIDQLNKYRSQSEELKMNNRFEEGRRVRGIENNNTKRHNTNDNESMIKESSRNRTTEWLPMEDNNY